MEGCGQGGCAEEVQDVWELGGVGAPLGDAVPLGVAGILSPGSR